MKKWFVLPACFGMLSVQGQLDMPPAGFNPRAGISEEIGITSIRIQYSRPGVKGREGKIWGELVPYGFGSFNFISNAMSSPWRAGANEATRISFEHPVRVEGKALAAGTYALYMAIGKDSVTLVFSSQKDAWGSFYYDPSRDRLRVNVKPVPLDKPVEWLKYEFSSHTENSCVISMQWERLSVPFRIEVDAESIVLERIREELTGAKGFVSAHLLQASMYCFNKKINMTEALGWATRAVTGLPFSQSGFDAYKNLAYGYEQLGRQQEADSVMNEGLQIAHLNQFTSYSKSLLAARRADRAIAVWQRATTRFGNVFAINNGLSYAWAAQGNFAKALEYAEKALAQAPPPMKESIRANIEKLKAGKDIQQ